MDRNPLTLPQLLTLIDEQAAVDNLTAYFDLGRAVPAYTGGRFDLLAGGGDRADVANRIGADDLVAVELLSVQVPGPVALDLLDGELGERVARQLSAIPTDVMIAQPKAGELLDGPAQAAWNLLEEPDGMGWVTAGKLLARKRPHLVPVYDRVVRCALGHPPKPWTWLHERFSADHGALDTHLRATQTAAALSDQVSTLRVLDVIVWMKHHREHRLSACPGLIV